MFELFKKTIDVMTNTHYIQHHPKTEAMDQIICPDGKPRRFRVSTLYSKTACSVPTYIFLESGAKARPVMLISVVGLLPMRIESFPSNVLESTTLRKDVCYSLVSL